MSTTHIQPTPTSPFAGVALLRAMADKWWLLLLRGIAAIVFGILAFIWPVITLLTLTLLWGAFALADGILALWGSISGPGGQAGSRVWLAIVGICGILAGLLAFAWPGITALVLLVFIAVWAIIIGVMQIWGAIQLRKEIEGEWLLILSGLLSVAFGVLLLVQPGAGALAVVWIIGWYAILAGCIYIALALRLKKLKHPA
ncbi:MAG TPA: HdeD family acid-resistance protein [Pseudolabrys sp.]|nr:HdeD family acid-resistance protein [Pseudolabrys sp.]